MRDDLGDMHRLVHVPMNHIPREIVYQEASAKRHANIIDRPCRELIERERGHPQTLEQWRITDTYATYYYARERRTICQSIENA